MSTLEERFCYRPKFSKKYGNVNGLLGKFFVFSVKSSVNKQTILAGLRQAKPMQVPLDIAFAEIILTGLSEIPTKIICSRMIIYFFISDYWG